MIRFSIIALGILFCVNLCAQTWDDTQSKDWPAACQYVEIQSSLDDEMQPAYFFQAKEDTPRPLVVSLHTWSGDYAQKDTLARMCIEQHYHYIHPNFRGPNNTFKACGSQFAIQDIDDAIAWVIAHAKVDTSEIHVIGASGGGYATLFTYMHSRYPIRTCSAWVPISDLDRWFNESKGRGNKYALHIAQATTGKTNFDENNLYIDKDEAIKRSPIFMQTPVENRKTCKLYIYTGIHDGYQGSVPVTQSLLFFNKVVKDFDPLDKDTIIPDRDIFEMLSSQSYPGGSLGEIGGRAIHYQRQYKDLVRLVVFEGKHEMLPAAALAPIATHRILTIGDSNGAMEGGWVDQLKKIRFGDFICNTCVSGNTIGFNNLGRSELNTLTHIDQYLDQAEVELNGPDAIMIMLGTNDCKAVFNDSLKKVPGNLTKLIKKIKAHPVYQAHKPVIYLVSPPPVGRDEDMIPKYHGSAVRIAWLFPKFQEIAREQDCVFVDVYNKLLPLWDYYTIDGIHLNPAGQKMLALIIDKNVK